MAGNINPVAVLRDATPEDVYREVEKCHKQAGAKFIVAAGCEVVADTAFENVRALKEYAFSHSAMPLVSGIIDKKKTSRIVDVAGKTRSVSKETTQP